MAWADHGGLEVNQFKQEATRRVQMNQQRTQVLRELSDIEKVSLYRSRKVIDILRRLADQMEYEADRDKVEEAITEAYFITESIQTYNLGPDRARSQK